MNLTGIVRAEDVLPFPISTDVKRGGIRGPILFKGPSYMTRHYRITEKLVCELDADSVT